MPRFFFHFRAGADSLSLDQDGVSLPDIEAAYLEAFQAAKDISQEWIKEGKNPRLCAFEVVNAAGDLVLDLPFSEALDYQAGRRPAHLSKALRTAMERGNRMMRLTAEVAQQVQALQENLRRSKDLLASLSKGGSG